MKRILQLLFALLAVGVASFILWKQASRSSSSIEQIQQDTARLVKQELKFLSRGHDYACYELTLYSLGGDTAKGYYRVPANTRKLPALIWIYDSKSGVDAASMLEGISESAHCAIVAFNCYSKFGHKSDGSLDQSEKSLSQGLIKGKHSVELFAQFLKKHHVVDSTLLYACGEGLGIASVISAASGSTGRLRGLILTEPVDVELAALLSENEILSLTTWISEVIPTPTVVVSEGSTFLRQLLPNHWGAETLDSMPEAPGEALGIIAALRAGLQWILKANPVQGDLPGLTDSTKVISVKK